MNTEILTKGRYNLKIRTGKKTKTTDETGTECCRQVFIFDNMVIKFAGDDSLNQNAFEATFYNEILEKKDKKYFAKILGQGEYDGEAFIIQERAEDTWEEATTKQLETFEKLEAKYNLKDIVFESNYRRNCALTTKGIKIFDVGVVENPNYE